MAKRSGWFEGGSAVKVYQRRWMWMWIEVRCGRWAMAKDRGWVLFLFRRSGETRRKKEDSVPIQ